MFHALSTDHETCPFLETTLKIPQDTTHAHILLYTSHCCLKPIDDYVKDKSGARLKRHEIFAIGSKQDRDYCNVTKCMYQSVLHKV